METIEREFYRSARGPAPTDEDTWRLVFNPRAMRLLVRHEWEAAGHNGVDEFEIGEFLAEDGAVPAELIKILFGRFPLMPKGRQGQNRFAATSVRSRRVTPL